MLEGKVMLLIGAYYILKATRRSITNYPKLRHIPILFEMFWRFCHSRGKFRFVLLEGLLLCHKFLQGFQGLCREHRCIIIRAVHRRVDTSSRSGGAGEVKESPCKAPVVGSMSLRPRPLSGPFSKISSKTSSALSRFGNSANAATIIQRSAQLAPLTSFLRNCIAVPKVAVLSKIEVSNERSRRESEPLPLGYDVASWKFSRSAAVHIFVDNVAELQI